MGSGLSTTKGLNPKQRKFALEYVAMPAGERSAARAAILAGYSPKTAKSQASRLLTHPAVRALILEHEPEKRIDLAKIDDAWVLRQGADLWDTPLAALFNEDGELLPIHKMPDFAQKLIAGFDVQSYYELDEGSSEPKFVRVVTSKIKLIDRLRVLDMIGRNIRVNAFGDKQKADAAQSFTDLLRAATAAIQKGQVIDVEWMEQLEKGV